MELFSRLFKQATDCQLVVLLEPQKMSALLFKESRLLGQIYCSVAEPQQALAPLQQLLQQYSCRRPEVILVLAEQCYQHTQIDKPKVPDAELLTALPWAVKDLISIAPENMQLDYFEMPTVGGAARINVVAAEKSWLAPWVMLFNETLKGQVRDIQTEELALLNLLQEQEAPALILWQKPEQDIDILLVHQQALHLSRNLRGTSGLTQMKGELLASVVDSVSLEVQRALDYFESNLRQPPVKTIFLAMEHPSLPDVAKLMAANLTPEVELLSHPCQQKNGLTRHSLAVFGALLPAPSEVSSEA